MSVGFASFRLGIAELAILGLIAPTQCDDLPEWSVEDMAVFRQAADQVLRNGENVPRPFRNGWDALTEARQAVENMESGWWPQVDVSGGLDDQGIIPVHDLTLPALWGAECLLARMAHRNLLASVPAVQAVELFIDRANDRLEALQVCQREGRVADDVPSLEDACDDLSDALAEAGPVFMVWPDAKPEPA